MCSLLTGRRYQSGHWSSCWVAVGLLKGLTHSFLNMMMIEGVII